MDKKKDNQIIVKIACVIASFILWLYVANTENPETVQRIKVPVTLVNQESLQNLKLAVVPEPEYYVTVSVKGPLLEVNKLSAKDFNVEADLSMYALKVGKNNINVSVEILNNYKNVYVMEPNNLLVEVTLDTLMQKSVPVKEASPIKVKQGYAKFPAVITPSNVYVSGPSQYVTNVSYVLAKGDSIETDKDVQRNLKLQAYDSADRVVNNVKIDPSSVDVVIPIRKTKTVNVVVKTSGSLKNDVQKKNIIPSISKVDISGEQAVLDTVSYIETDPIYLSNITETKNVDTKLIIPSGVTLVSGSGTISVKIEVSKVVSKNFSVGIKFNNLNESYTFNSDKSSISLVLSGEDSIINSLNNENIICIADLSNLGEGDGMTVPINIQVPSGVTIVSANPNNVKVKISSKAQTPSDNTPKTE